MRYICKRCQGSVDTGELTLYPGVGDVCKDCVAELDAEAEHRRRFSLSKEQQQEIKDMIPGILLGA